MLKVIIADDEARVCSLIQMLIDWQELNMELAGTASNGLQALELIQTCSPDILITDIRMPGCHGLELIERAKRLKPALEAHACAFFNGGARQQKQAADAEQPGRQPVGEDLVADHRHLPALDAKPAARHSQAHRQRFAGQRHPAQAELFGKRAHPPGRVV